MADLSTLPTTLLNIAFNNVVFPAPVFPTNINQNKNKNKEEEIQERFNKLQDKLNNLQNIIANRGPKYDSEKNLYISPMNSVHNSNFNDFNNNNYKRSTYNPDYNFSNMNQNFNNNIVINNSQKDLSRIHNQMQNKNPRASLIKKMAQFHINDNINNNNNRNIYSTKNNFGKTKNQVNIKKTNQINNFNINKYPHEIQQIKEYNNLNSNLGNNKYINNNNNNNYFAKKINNQDIKNYNQYQKFNNNNINNMNNNIRKNNNINNNMNINSNQNVGNDSNSDNLSDLAEDLLEFQMEQDEANKNENNQFDIYNNFNNEDNYPTKFKDNKNIINNN